MDEFTIKKLAYLAGQVKEAEEIAENFDDLAAHTCDFSRELAALLS